MENKNHDQTFQSKVDTWLALVLAVGVVGGWFSLARRMWAGRAIDGLDVVVPLLVSAFIIWVYSTTYYEVTADQLIVHSGPIRKAVPLSSVQRLRATHNPRSAPALSLDRIEVTYGSKRVLISPRDKRGFVSAVLRRAPGAVLEGLSAT